MSQFVPGFKSLWQLTSFDIGFEAQLLILKRYFTWRSTRSTYRLSPIDCFTHRSCQFPACRLIPTFLAPVLFHLLVGLFVTAPPFGMDLDYYVISYDVFLIFRHDDCFILNTEIQGSYCIWCIKQSQNHEPKPSSSSATLRYQTFLLCSNQVNLWELNANILQERKYTFRIYLQMEDENPVINSALNNVAHCTLGWVTPMIKADWWQDKSVNHFSNKSTAGLLMGWIGVDYITWVWMVGC